ALSGRDAWLLLVTALWFGSEVVVADGQRHFWISVLISPLGCRRRVPRGYASVYCTSGEFQSLSQCLLLTHSGHLRAFACYHPLWSLLASNAEVRSSNTGQNPLLLVASSAVESS